MSKTSQTAAAGSCGPDPLGPLLAPGGSGHLVAGRDQPANQRTPHRPGCAGDEDPHRVSSRSATRASQQAPSAPAAIRSGVAPAAGVALRFTGVEEVVDRVEPIPERAQPEQGRPPAGPHDRDRERDAGREVEGADVADVVGVLDAVAADLVEEGVRGDQRQQSEDDVEGRREGQDRLHRALGNHRAEAYFGRPLR